MCTTCRRTALDLQRPAVEDSELQRPAVEDSELQRPAVEESNLQRASAANKPDLSTNDTHRSFNVVKCYPDGRCFFRCVAVYSLGCLRTAVRSRHGKLKDQQLFDMEQSFADEIRREVIAFLCTNLNMLNEMTDSLPFLLDRQVHGYFTSVDSRLEAMANPCEYAGVLEMLAVSFLFQRPIHVYQSQPDKTFKVIAKLPMFSNLYESNQPIMLLHEFDTVKASGHFDLLACNGDTGDQFSREQFKMKIDLNATSASFHNVIQLPQLPLFPFTKEDDNIDGSSLDNNSLEQSLLNTNMNVTQHMDTG